MSKPAVSPSCSNLKVLPTIIFIELISKTHILRVDLKCIDCIIAEKQCGPFYNCHMEYQLKDNYLYLQKFYYPRYNNEI
jgi:hypothetical protein